jgi:hypothetical protein
LSFPRKVYISNISRKVYSSKTASSEERTVSTT